MKKYLLLLFITTYGYSQVELKQDNCLTYEPKISETSKKSEINLTNCSHTTPYWYNDNLYIPNENNNSIYVRVNLIFLTKPDGTGNFEENNAEHNAFLDEMQNFYNARLQNLVESNSCQDNNFIGDTKIQCVFNRIYYPDPKWDFVGATPYYYNFDGPCAASTDTAIYGTNGFSDYLFPSYGSSTNPNFYLNDVDNIISNDPTIPKGINIYYANNGVIYDDLVVNQNYQDYIYYQDELDAINCDMNEPIAWLERQSWGVSEYPSSTDLNKSSRIFSPDKYITFEWFKNVVSPFVYQPYPWPQTRSSVANLYARGLLHEIGHSFNLSHEFCDIHIMNPSQNSSRKFLQSYRVGRIYRALSTTNIRNFVTEDSYTNTSIHISNNETWDLDWRIYSDVIIETGNELRITCKTIMSPQAKIIVQDGASLILEGGVIESANGQTWEGIKIEGTGYFKILPDTPVIENNYFYAYVDFSTAAKNSQSEKDLFNTALKLELLENNSNEIKDKLRIYPNPSSQNITISSTFKFNKYEIYDGKTQQLIILSSNQGRQKSVDISKLKKGVYLIKVFGENTEILYSKFIKY